MKITRHEEFEVAHILPNYKGPCGNLHGHTYKIEVTVEGPQNPHSYNMVMDFKDLKTAIRECIPDHRFVYNMNNTSDVEKDLVEVLQKHKIRYVGLPFETTADDFLFYIILYIGFPEYFTLF